MANVSPITCNEARRRCLPGWNIRCNHCGSYGADWTRDGARPGWGELALCPRHMGEYAAMKERHREELECFRRVRFEQERAVQA